MMKYYKNLIKGDGMKRKFNWIDMLILGLVIISIYFAYSLIFNTSDKVNNSFEVELRYRARGLVIESVDAIKIGDIFRDNKTKQIIGALTDKEFVESYDLVETGDGRIIKARNPDRFDLYMTIKGSANITDEYIKIGNRDMRIEDTVELNSKMAFLISTLVGLEILE